MHLVVKFDIQNLKGAKQSHLIYIFLNTAKTFVSLKPPPPPQHTKYD